MIWITIFIYICLFILFLQDILYRHVHIVVLILLFGVSVAQQYLRFSNLIIKIVSYNMGLFLFTFLLLTLYMAYKNRGFINPFKNYFGLGDLFFYLTVSPLFMPDKFLFFFIISLLFAVLLHFCFRKISKHQTIPLAGYTALLLILISGIETCFHTFKLTLI